MTDIASLFIRVDSSGVVTASKDLNKLTEDSKKTEKATDSVTAGFAKLRQAIIGLGVAYAAMKVSQYIRDAAFMAAKYEMLGVSMKTVGNIARYTGAQMEEAAVKMQKLGIAMVDSRNATIQLVTAGLKLADAEKFASVARDAAVVGMTNTTDALTNIILAVKSGETEILKTLGINVNFEQSYRDLEVSMGRAKGALTEVEKTQARANAVFKDGASRLGVYDDAMKTTMKQCMSLERHFDNLQVLVGKAFTPAMAEIIETITAKVTGLNGELSGEGMQKIEDWGNKFRLTVVGIEAEIMWLATIIDKIGGTLTQIVALSGTVARWSPVGLAGRAFGKDPGGDAAEWAIKQNEKLEARYKATEKQLNALVIKYGELADAYAYNMSPAGKAAAEQAKQDAAVLESIRIQNAELAKSDQEKAEAAAKSAEATKKFYEIWDKTKQSLSDKMQLAGLDGVERKLMESKLNAEALKRQFEEFPPVLRQIAEAYIDKAKGVDDQQIRKEAEDQILQDKMDLYKDLAGFEDEYRQVQLEWIKKIRQAEIDAGKDKEAVNKKAEESIAKISQAAFEAKSKQVDEALGQMGTAFNAVGSMYDKASSEYAAMQEAAKAMIVLQNAVAVANAVASIANQGLGDPYTAFGRIATMTAAMGTLLASAGLSLGGGGGSSAPALPASTVLGAAAGTGSESIANSYELLQDTYDMQYRELSGINESMKDLNANITGLVTSIVRTGGVEGFAGSGVSSMGSAEKLMGDVFGGAHETVANLLTLNLLPGLAGKIDDFVGNLMGSVGSEIFGGGTTTSAYASGIQYGGASVRSLQAGGGVGAQKYTSYISQTDGGWFGSDSTSYYTQTGKLDAQVNTLLNKVFQNMGNTLVFLAEGLGADVGKALNYVFKERKINLIGLDAEGINKKLNEYFSMLGDKAVQRLFGSIVAGYQQVGEGLMETAARLVIDKAVVVETLKMTNQAFHGSTKSLIAFSEAIIAMAGDLETLQDAAATYYDKFFTEAEQQKRLQGQLRDVFKDINEKLPTTREGYRDIVEGLDLTTTSGQAAYVTLLKMAEYADQYYSYREEREKARADREKQRLSDLINEQGKVVAEFQGYANRLKSIRESMKLDGAQGPLSYLSAQRVLSQARGGDFSGINSLDVSSASSTAGFATRVDYERNFFKTLNALTELDRLTGDQLSTAEKSLNALQSQLDLLQNIDKNIAASTGGTAVGYALGGIASGPTSGYAATLHGTELVVSPSASYPATVKGDGGDIVLIKEVRALRAEIKAGNQNGRSSAAKITKILQRFDELIDPEGLLTRTA